MIIEELLTMINQVPCLLRFCSFLFFFVFRWMGLGGRWKGGFGGFERLGNRYIIEKMKGWKQRGWHQKRVTAAVGGGGGTGTRSLSLAHSLHRQHSKCPRALHNTAQPHNAIQHLKSKRNDRQRGV
jgi:hypothetical protein